MRFRTTALLVAFLLAPLASAAEVATDPSGDATQRTATGDAAAAPASADLLRLSIVDGGGALAWNVTSAGAAQTDMEAVDTTIAFQHGGRVYRVVASDAIHLWISDEAGVAQRMLGELDGERDGAELRFTMPKELVRDVAGMPLADGARLSGITAVTSARDEVQGPDPEQGFFCCTPWWTVHDRMPDDGGATYRVPASEPSGIRLWSDAPLRASNGGGDRFVYSLTVGADRDASMALNVTGVPDGWQVTAPQGSLDLQAGASATFPIRVETPSGHRHGGTETFQVRLGDASVRLGIHYLDVPQPAGHHPRLFLHSDGTEGGVIETGYAPGRLWMNTVAEDPMDDGAPVDSTQSSFGGEEARWSVCLAEGLRLGLDLHNGTGALDVSLASERPYGDVRLSGALYHYGPGPALPCDAASYRAERNETVVATIPATGAQVVQGSTRFEADVVGEVDRIAYQEGAMLVLELVASFSVPDSQAPGPLVLEPGGELLLPLREYRDVQDVVVPDWRDDPVLEVDDGESREGEKAPVGWAWVVALLGVAWWRRR